MQTSSRVCVSLIWIDCIVNFNLMAKLEFFIGSILHRRNIYGVKAIKICTQNDTAHAIAQWTHGNNWYQYSIVGKFALRCWFQSANLKRISENFSHGKKLLMREGSGSSFLLVRGRKWKKLQCGFDSLKLFMLCGWQRLKIAWWFLPETFPSLKMLKVLFSALNFVSKQSEKKVSKENFDISFESISLSPHLPPASKSIEKKIKSKGKQKKKLFSYRKIIWSKNFFLRSLEIAWNGSSVLAHLSSINGSKVFFRYFLCFLFFSSPSLTVCHDPPSEWSWKKVSNTHSLDLIYIFLLSPQLKCNQSPSKKRQKGLKRHSKKQKLWTRIRRKP